VRIPRSVMKLCKFSENSVKEPLDHSLRTKLRNAIHKGIAGRGSRLRGTRRGGRMQAPAVRAGRPHLPRGLEDERGAHAHAAQPERSSLIDLRLDFGVGVVDQRRHKNL